MVAQSLNKLKITEWYALTGWIIWDYMGYELYLIKLFVKSVPPNIQIKLAFWENK